MDSRERTFLALRHEEPDRVPLDLWLSAGFRAKLEAHTGMPTAAFLDEHDVDLRYIEGPRYIGPALRRWPDGSAEDLWGVRRRPAVVQSAGGSERYMELMVSPLAALTRVAEVEAYPRWPSPDWFDYSVVAAQCRAVRARGRLAVFMGDRLNRLAQLKPAMYLRGIEQILADLVLAPEMARAIFARIRSFYREYAARLLAAAAGGLDLLLTGDDFGTQTGPLLSAGMWREFLLEGFGEYIELAHAHGVRVAHHTCGGVRPLIPLFLDAGLDVLQSVQPEAAGMEARSLKSEFGARLAFQGGLSIQRTLPFGTPAAVWAEVRARLAALAPGGGYILGPAHNIQADAPVANLLALLAAHREYGSYPLAL